jgi:hypothetical protein
VSQGKIMAYKADFCVSRVSDRLYAFLRLLSVSMMSHLNFVVSLDSELQLAEKLTIQWPSF